MSSGTTFNGKSNGNLTAMDDADNGQAIADDPIVPMAQLLHYPPEPSATRAPNLPARVTVGGLDDESRSTLTEAWPAQSNRAIVGERDDTRNPATVAPSAGDAPADPAVAAPPPAKPKRRVLLGVLLIGLIVGAATGVYYWIASQNFETTDDAIVEGRIIPISPQVTARVKAVHVSDNQAVHRGDSLVEFDPTDYQVALDQARANQAAAEGRFAQAVAQVDSAKADRDQAQAALAVAQASAKSADSDYNRYQDAFHQNAGSISRQQMDSATAMWMTTQAQVQQARAKLAWAQTQITTCEAAVQGAQGELAKAQADVHRAQVNLSYCNVVAPEDGRVTRKNVEPGSYVQAGQSLLAIVPPDYWIIGNFKETQLDRIRAGQPVNITIDAYPDQTFTGMVDSIQAGTGSRFSVLPSENATGNFVKIVQRVPVKILFTPRDGTGADHPLAAGMSAVPSVRVR